MTGSSLQNTTCIGLQLELSWLALIAPKRIIFEGFSWRPTWLDILSNKVVSKALRSSATSDWDSGSPLIIIFHLLLWRSLLSWCTLLYPVYSSLRFLSDTASELFWWASCTSLGITSLTSFFITSESWFSIVEWSLAESCRFSLQVRRPCLPKQV